MRFVLGAIGHIAGVINPAARNKRSHWIATASPAGDAEDWLDGRRRASGQLVDTTGPPG
jgi:polyhydroxyalkanoate synthase